MEFLFGDPEEIKRMQDQAEMTQDVMRHDIENFFDGLDKDQLVTLRLILRFTHSEGYAEYAAGHIGAILKYKFKVCGCGRDHDAELLSMDETPQPSEPDVVSVTVDPDEVLEHYGMRLPTQADYDAGLQHGDDEEPVICVGCGALSQSLLDRMLKEPGVKGCPGCQEKAKWG